MARKRDANDTDIRNDTAQNWIDLAEHFKDKVHKRTSDLSYLHTRAGFLIASAVISLQIIITLPEFKHDYQLVGLAVASVTGLASLVMAIVSMHKGKSTSPLKPEEMILSLTEQELSRASFGNWLAKSYSAANRAFNDEYNKKYNQQIAAGVLLIISITIALVLKGTYQYVG